MDPRRHRGSPPAREGVGSPAARRAGAVAGVVGLVAGAGWLARRAVERRVFAAVRGDR